MVYIKDYRLTVRKLGHNNKQFYGGVCWCGGRVERGCVFQQMMESKDVLELNSIFRTDKEGSVYVDQ